MNKLIISASMSILASFTASAIDQHNLQIETNFKPQLKIEDIASAVQQDGTLNEVYPNLERQPLSVQVQDPKQIKAQLQLGQLNTAQTLTTSTTTSTPAQRSGCPNLDLNNAVYTAFTAQGQIQCYSVDVTTATKIEGVMVNIPANVDYNLFLFKLEDDNSLTPLDVSNQANAVNEQVFYKVDPGAYILAAESTQWAAADNAIMGWFSHPDFDANESNDKLSQATVLSPIATVQGNIDNQNDLDFFTYQTTANQSQVKLNFSASNQFILEIWGGSSWLQAPNNQLVNLNTTGNSTVVLRARANPTSQPPVSAQYAFTLSNPDAGVKISNTRVWNNENLTNLLSPSLLEAHNKLGMSGTVVDAAGAAVPFAQVVLAAVSHQGQNLGAQGLVADSQGQFSTTIDLIDCAGVDTVNRRNRSYRGTPTNPEMWWDITYQFAQYLFILQDSGGTNQYVFNHNFAHICKERITKTCYWQRDYINGGEEYKCF
ncbi:carboxypeptidase regulatory-like domain-containing protein [Pseudoalteromonas luteoviolacea]|uniref:carboxypeptidase-like regulatory domain-containing protein n=1 Tax=Pseudoalteromonas luteoviolacea TaxID=43657 RepID=UPI001B36FB12|nr:carboxypeptidase-like regulatory domain-containing protein [Pseudoalteromonas luteoviolacea]MBQ4811774.1 carboxypeptidase regulatory-like domain-containing protein [Pseudoalteromonas luteoviolacea]